MGIPVAGEGFEARAEETITPIAERVWAPASHHHTPVKSDRLQPTKLRYHRVDWV